MSHSHLRSRGVITAATLFGTLSLILAPLSIAEADESESGVAEESFSEYAATDDRSVSELDGSSGSEDTLGPDNVEDTYVPEDRSISDDDWTPYGGSDQEEPELEESGTSAPTESLMRSPQAPTASAPVVELEGHIDDLVYSAERNQLKVRGWTRDKNTDGPAEVDIVIDSQVVATLTTDLSRPDVKKVRQTQSEDFGFETWLTVAAGKHTVCLQNPEDDSNRFSCRSATVTPSSSHKPQGHLDQVFYDSASKKVVARGWSIDRDTNDPIAVHIYADHKLVAYGVADQTRTDVQRVMGLSRDSAGFSFSFTLSAGTHTVCAYGINVPKPAVNPSVGCLKVTVPEPAEAKSRAHLDQFTEEDGTITFRGWAFDPVGAGQARVDVYVDNRLYSMNQANQSRPDVQRVFSLDHDQAGFNGTIKLSSGTHKVCLYAIDHNNDHYSTLRCGQVTSSASSQSSGLAKVTTYQGFYRFSMHNHWQGQETNYWCGPASGVMVLATLGYTQSVSGVALSQSALAQNSFMATNQYRRTAWAYNKFAVGMNNWTGQSGWYHQQGSPSAATFKTRVVESFTKTGRPVVTDMQEYSWGAHVNNHPRSTFSHIMPVEGYNPSTNEVMLMDPGAQTVFPSSGQMFSVDLNTYAQFLTPFGIYY